MEAGGRWRVELTRRGWAEATGARMCKLQPWTRQQHPVHHMQLLWQGNVDANADASCVGSGSDDSVALSTAHTVSCPRRARRLFAALVRVPKVHIRLDEVAYALFEDLEFRESSLRLMSAISGASHVPPSILLPRTHFTIPHKLEPLPAVQPDAEYAARLGRIVRLERGAGEKRRGEGEHELGLRPCCAGCPAIRPLHVSLFCLAGKGGEGREGPTIDSGRRTQSRCAG